MVWAARDVRETFLSFFEERGHTRVASSALVPENDATLLFVNSGMVPFKRALTGEEKRAYTRAVSTQKCMRVSGKHNDLEEVGRSARHHTFFEMLGNFSFGDYFKHDAIRLAWELITEHYRIDPADLVVSVFREDDEAADIWEREIGLPPSKIYRLDEDENFWAMGDTGPCGPCTEIHLDRGPIPGVVNDDPSSESGRFLEFWNLVFMQFNRDAAGNMEPLPKPSVDTGAGLERVVTVLNGMQSTYETDLFTPILARAQELAGVSLGSDPDKDVSLKVVADHARAVAFLIGDGVLPANEGRGYVLRRILRRASRHGVLLGIDGPFLHSVAGAVIDEMGGVFPELEERRDYVIDRVQREEERFLETLRKGLSLLEDEIGEAKAAGTDVLPGPVVFRLYDTFGFPVDLTDDILRGRGMHADQEGFRSEMEAQRSRSRQAWKGSGDEGVAAIYGRMASELSTSFVGFQTLEHAAPVLAILRGGEPVDEATAGDEIELIVAETPFYAESGGQVGDVGAVKTPGGELNVNDVQRPSGELVVHRGKVTSGVIRVGESARLAVDTEARAATVRNHSGTHLLHAALREVVGPQAMQRGSLVSPDRLRFDFNHDSPLTEEEIERIEDRVNTWIEANDAGAIRTMDYKAAVDAGAMALFGEKYTDDVRVVSFGDVSTELCGGTHATATGDIGLLKIISETGIASGVRRIEALTGLGALHHLREQQRTLRELGELLKVPANQAADRIRKILEERKAAEKEIASLKRAQLQGGSSSGDSGSWEQQGELWCYARKLEGANGKELRAMVDDLRNQKSPAVVCLVSDAGEGKVAVAIGVTPELRDRLPAGELMKDVAKVVGGKGGGRPDFAQGGGTDVSRIDDALAAFGTAVASRLA
ncbi:MAG: alanine--tRNA ligase [Deltaproteobacteria bacterium]|nr:alanine--tRNA ligase [Deltaproteobacteria bacterium]MBW2394191.1 alanine--tRNA ligase [Deltaproteobacteria bacterium]